MDLDSQLGLTKPQQFVQSFLAKKKTKKSIRIFAKIKFLNVSPEGFVQSEFSEATIHILCLKVQLGSLFTTWYIGHSEAKICKKYWPFF